MRKRYTANQKTQIVLEVLKEEQTLAQDATLEGIADLLVTFLQNRLPTHPPQELHNMIERKYSYEQAMMAYEHFLMG